MGEVSDKTLGGSVASSGPGVVEASPTAPRLELQQRALAPNSAVGQLSGGHSNQASPASSEGDREKWNANSECSGKKWTAVARSDHTSEWSGWAGAADSDAKERSGFSAAASGARENGGDLGHGMSTLCIWNLHAGVTEASVKDEITLAKDVGSLTMRFQPTQGGTPGRCWALFKSPEIAARVKNFLSSRKWSVDFAKREMRPGAGHEVETSSRPGEGGDTGTAGAVVAGVGGAAKADEADCDFESWLKRIELEHGAPMMAFLPALSREFVNLHELCNAVLAVHEGAEPMRPITCIEPTVYEAIGISRMGQKLAFAKGALDLAKKYKSTS